MKTLVFGFIPLFAACSMMFGQAGMNGVWRLGEIGQPFLWEVVLRDDAGQLSGTVSSCASGQGPVEISGAKVEPADVQQALIELGARARYNQLRQQIMTLTECSKRTAQMAIAAACQRGLIAQADGHYCLPD